MDYSSYVFVGLGVALSVVGFFLKRVKEAVDLCQHQNNKIMVSLAQYKEKTQNIEKLLEDRRHDVRKLYDIIGKNGN